MDNLTEKRPPLFSIYIMMIGCRKHLIFAKDKRHLGIDHSNKFDVSALDLHYLCTRNQYLENMPERKLKEGFDGQCSIVLPKVILEMVQADPLVAGVYITDIGYYPHAAHHYRERLDPISQYVFIYCVDGSGWYEVGGKRYRVTADQYFILPAGEAHRYGADEETPWTIYWMHFGGPLASYYADGTTEPKSIGVDEDSRIRYRIGLFDEIFNSLARSYDIESIRYAMSVFHHYLASLRYIDRFRGVAASAPFRDTADRIKHFLEENIGRHLTLDDIAEYVHLSPSRMSALFRQATGHSPMAYFNLLKIRCACGYLDTTDMTLTQIACRLGIEDPFYFSRLFTKIMGVSPKRYRSRIKD